MTARFTDSHSASDMSGLADADLVHVAQACWMSAPSRTAVDVLLGRYQRRVYAWAYRYVRHHEDAREAVQEILMRAYQQLPAFASRSKFSTWLFAVTRNYCLNAVRRRRALESTDEGRCETAETRGTPEDLYERRQAEAHLMATIRSTLDPVEERALWMRCIDGVPVDEITDALDLGAVSGARGVLQRARRKLRTALAPAGAAVQ